MSNPQTNPTTALRQLLAGILPGPKLDQVVQAWLACQSGATHCSVRRFVEQIALELQLEPRVADQLTVKLFGYVLKQPPAALPAVAKPSPLTSPAPVSTATASATNQPIPATRAKGDPVAQVFESLVNELEQLNNTRFGAQMDTFDSDLARQLKELSSLTALTSSLVTGERTPGQLAAHLSTEADRQTFIHAYYLALCSVHGPAHADRLLSDAVRKAEQNPLANKYPPRRLL